MDHNAIFIMDLTAFSFMYIKNVNKRTKSCFATGVTPRSLNNNKFEDVVFFIHCAPISTAPYKLNHQWEVSWLINERIDHDVLNHPN